MAPGYTNIAPQQLANEPEPSAARVDASFMYLLHLPQLSY